MLSQPAVVKEDYSGPSLIRLNLMPSSLLLLLLEDQLVVFNMNGFESAVAIERWK